MNSRQSSTFTVTAATSLPSADLPYGCMPTHPLPRLRVLSDSNEGRDGARAGLSTMISGNMLRLHACLRIFVTHSLVAVAVAGIC